MSTSNRLLFAASPFFHVRDVTLSAADDLQTHREKLARVVLDEMHQFVGLLDPEGNVLEINRAALEGTGITLDGVRGKPFWEARWWLVSRETQRLQRDLVRRAREGEFVRCDMEIYGQAGGLETMVIDYSLSPVRDIAGRIVCLLAEGRNITGKRRAEAEVAGKKEELEQLRTPLALVLGPADSMVAAGNGLTERQRHDLSVIKRDAAALLTHVNDLLDLATHDGGNQTVKSTDVSRDVLQEALASQNDDLTELSLELNASRQALQDSVDRLREYEQAAEGVDEMIVVLDRDYRYLMANRAVLAYRGLSREQLMGRSLSEVMDPEIFETVAKPRLDACFEGKVVKYEVRYASPHHGERDLFVSYFPVEGSSGVDRVVCILQDITDRKNAEATLRQLSDALEQSNRASQRLAAIVESSDDAILSQDLERVIMSWNPGAERMFGHSAAEAIGQAITIVVPPTRRATEDLVLARIRAGEPVEMETVWQHKNGTSVAISLMVSPIKDAGGHVVGASKIARNITERKQAEAALHRLSGQLLRLEDEERRRLARDLHDSTAQRLAALSMNLAVVNEADSALDARARRALAESAVLADECLREIRTVSYLLHPPELDELGLQSALARYVDGFVRRSGISVEADVPPDLGRLPQGVETTVFRIVQECLTNIHRHSGSRTASIRLHRRPTELVLEVQDAGTGLAAKTPSGVGITSMQERLQQFGGSLQISSRPGGTQVKAVIPLSAVV